MDVGDLFFIFVFIIIVISNVVKQMKKARKQAGEGGGQKKPGLKTALELVLEEAKKQMENRRAEGRPSGWETVLPGKSAGEKAPRPAASKPPADLERRQVDKAVTEPRKPEKTREILRSSPGSKESVGEKKVFEPVCLGCGKSMKVVRGTGEGRQTGVLVCAACGDAHRYQILDGDFTLTRIKAPGQSLRLRERRERPAAESASAALEKTPAGAVPPEAAAPAPVRHESPAHGPAFLRDAVVWAEILAPPVALKENHLSGGVLS